MSSTQGNDAPETPKVKPTERQMNLLAIIMQNVRSKPDVDWDAVAAQAGLKNKAVAVESYRQMQKKFGWSTGTSSAKSSSAVAGSPSTPTKVSKRTGNVGSAKKARTKKVAVKDNGNETTGSGSTAAAVAAAVAAATDAWDEEASVC